MAKWGHIVLLKYSNEVSEITDHISKKLGDNGVPGFVIRIFTYTGVDGWCHKVPDYKNLMTTRGPRALRHSPD